MLVVPAYAKVNLALEVTGRRPDGWHDVATALCTVDWHDLAGVHLCRRSGPAALRLSGPFAEGVPPGEDNLAVRAAALLLRIAGATGFGFELWLSKQVPAAAGLGGGSADAAAVLRAGSTLLAAQGAAVAPEELTAAAAELGSDVPAVLAGGGLLAGGRGERLAPLRVPTLHLAIAVAGASVTAAAYAALTDEERRATGRVARLAAALEEDEVPAALLGSALEAAACRAAPGLADSLARLRALTPQTPWHLTGSGGAAFAVAAGAAEAASLAASARNAGFPARACRTVATRLGPLPPRAGRAAEGPSRG
ncbi:MAG TPA: 4-(cytidine 5'-diphospho)-2-C-methyl-D-erythritol kinase [Candidatus Dormibacteraeota bacterium]|nr:4-(cytidine 5'-diphospho)-2-C-methyl-D-erythritol kinase [Candidatus Dormibacteraeota bacterium]